MALRERFTPSVAQFLLATLLVAGCGSASQETLSYRSEGDDELGRVRAVLDVDDADRARLVIYSHDQGLRVSCETAGWHDLPIPVVGRAGGLSPGLHQIQVDRGTDILEKNVVLEPGVLYVGVVSLRDDAIRIFSTASCEDFTVSTEFAGVLADPPLVDFGDAEAQAAPPQILELGSPDYPQHLRDWAVEGSVFAHVLVTREGRAGQICLKSSDHPLLDQFVIEAAMQCEFVPGEVDGIPVDTWVTVPYKFSLD